jgi:DNA-binding LacI/PurR family transcriptional regulator
MVSSATIKDVARRAGVSTATVSYVLNDSRPVGDDTRERVLRAVNDLGYRPSVIARGLRAGESRMIGYSWRPAPPDQFNPILEKFIHSVAEAAGCHGYHVITFPYPDPYDELDVYREMVESGRVDGFVLPNTRFDDQRIRYLLEVDFPFVAFGRANADWEFPWVDVDGASGFRQAVAHLVELGHRCIACAVWSDYPPAGEDRLAGYRAAMAEAGLAVAPDWVVRIGNDHSQAYQVTEDWLRLPSDRRPSAVVAASDFIAIGVMNAAMDGGLTVGRDLAVVGFDDAPVAGYLRPPLTSLRQPIQKVAQEAVEMLIELVNGRTPASRQVLLQPQLVVRGSTGEAAG